MARKSGPIILIDDDEDECELIKEVVQSEKITNEVICFFACADALQYLQTTEDRPFIIFCDLNMPVMSGLELRRLINQDETLKRKSIPFIFLTTTASPIVVKEAYEMSVQGFFEKGKNMHDIAQLITEICAYWQRCRHPNDYL